MRSPLFPAGAALLLLAGACSSPPTQFYALSSTAPAATSAPATGKLSIAVGPVSIPALVDRPQMVLDAGPNQVRVDEFSRWAAPLADEITRVTVVNLGRLAAPAEVWPAAALGSAKADVRVRIDVQELRSEPGKSAELDARWTVQRGDSLRSGRARFSEPSPGPGADALAAAHSKALARLAEQIAEAVRSP